MPDPRLSVVVPFYGVEDYIHDCLESIRAQTLEDMEVILVDDGSRDGSIDIARDFEARDPRFRVIQKENAGLGPARNTGVEHAQGEYLTFVDSDDLITRHGFAALVDSLDRSGSSFAGGNARRFNITSGVKPSWSHLQPFASTRIAAHIHDFPAFARDRMVWNKIYRRSFWDEFGYEFPAIRYEDYPVTLKAHLDALTVDMHAATVYYWRERESGDSITQQVWKYDNLLDRVASAEMVLANVAGAPLPVQSQTKLMLAQVDFVAIMQAFASVPPEQAAPVLELALGFVEALGHDVIVSRSRFDQLQYHAMIDHDVELLRELAIFRQQGGLRGGLRAQKARRTIRRFEYPFPGQSRTYLSRDLFLAPTKDLGMRTSVTDMCWVADGLQVRGTSEIRHLRAGNASWIKIWAVTPDMRHALTVQRFPDVDSHGEVTNVGFSFTLSRADLAAWAESGHNVSFDVQVGQRTSSRNMPLAGLATGSARWTPGDWASPSIWAQPGANSRGQLQLTWHPSAWRLVDAAVIHDAHRGPTLVIECTAPRPMQAAQIVLSGQRHADPLRYPAKCVVGDGTTQITAHLPLKDIASHTGDDDPFLRSTKRTLAIRAAGKNHPVLWSATSLTRGTIIDDHAFRLTRREGGFVVLEEATPRQAGEDISVVTRDQVEHLVVEGRTWSASAESRATWRRYLPGTEIHVDCGGTFTVEGEQWRLESPVTELLDAPGEVSEIDSLASVVDWSLVWVDASGEHASSVLPEPSLSALLPVRLNGQERRGMVTKRTDTLHLEVHLDR